MFVGLFALNASTLMVVVDNAQLAQEASASIQNQKQEQLHSSTRNFNHFSFLEEMLVNGQEDDDDDDDRLHDFTHSDFKTLLEDDEKSFEFRISQFELHCGLKFRAHLIRILNANSRLLIEVFQI